VLHVLQLLQAGIHDREYVNYNYGDKCSSSSTICSSSFGVFPQLLLLLMHKNKAKSLPGRKMHKHSFSARAPLADPSIQLGLGAPDPAGVRGSDPAGEADPLGGLRGLLLRKR